MDLEDFFDKQESNDTNENTDSNIKKFKWFDLVSDISFDKKNLSKVKKLTNKQINGYMLNKCFGNYQDTIFLANATNVFPTIEDKLVNDFLLYSVIKKRRFSKWSKDLMDPSVRDIIEHLQKKYNVSYKTAREYYKLIPIEERQEILNRKRNAGRIDT